MAVEREAPRSVPISNRVSDLAELVLQHGHQVPREGWETPLEAVHHHVATSAA
eukprot:CAMPEP_0185164818 /NCGR_PEP_ID=MMETSP1139-20130426/9980_1 /TAXON_ID=298111 /ORGANISM="Pavlova sp., Strain CCMP459" /LENGTH=52 /DNA_ID=CAMNT_0027730203 /DNA_START=168 /DNA_END=323 /DNA_ORIENTATION=+